MGVAAALLEALKVGAARLQARLQAAGAGL